MRIFCIAICFSAALPLWADPQECLPDGTAEQLVENLPRGSRIHRDCYHCKVPSYETILVAQAETRPCHLHDSAGERAVYVTGKIVQRFKMQTCGVMTDKAKADVPLDGELLVLNYAWLEDPKTREAVNIADMFGENSHHMCKRFTYRENNTQEKSGKKSKKRK